jgi:hypothetical protein
MAQATEKIVAAAATELGEKWVTVTVPEHRSRNLAKTYAIGH